MEYLSKACPDCKKEVNVFRQGKTWVVYNSDDEYGPHKCEIARNGRSFLIKLGYYACKTCGQGVHLIQKDDKKFVMGMNNQRHRCNERLLPFRDRFWSGDGTYPWEYPMVGGKMSMIVRETHPRRKDMPRNVKVIPVDEWVLSEEDLRFLDEYCLNSN